MDKTFTELSSRKLFGASQLVSVVEHVCEIWRDQTGECVRNENLKKNGIYEPDNGKHLLPNIHIGEPLDRLADGNSATWP